MSDKEDRVSALPGIAAMGLIVTGVAGLVHAFVFGTGWSMLASVAAFGIIFYVSLK
ncbi:MAG: hypothetical protein JSW47_11045 [Phycisphaerales bacterium]|nr:MAG: hypothetical protein JSW47_11045 [Phycisphaerales bacterium]UCF17207.1 MAG: hypothetical protein JSW59_07055 [Phycisphaerales bacterium]